MAKFRFSEYKRRTFIPIAGMALASYYFFVLVPLKRHAQSLDAPLQGAWQKLSTTLEQPNTRSIDFLHITNQLNETRQALQMLEEAKRKASARLQLGATVRARMSAPFQLVEYQNERSKALDELTKMAKQQQVAIEPPVLLGFPEHTVDVKQPELLWAALSLIDGLLTSAVHCKVETIHSLETLIPATNAPGASEVVGRVAEIPVQVEFTGPATQVGQLLQSLPLNAEEIHAAHLPETSPDKAPLFIERLILKKQTPEKPDELRVSLRVVGFVLRE